jgi:ribosome-associated translation inhibitor RaiA
LTDAIRTQVESRVEWALGAFAPWIKSVSVRLEDVPADGADSDRRCMLVADLRGGGMVRGNAVHEDLFSAADEAAARTRRGVQRYLAQLAAGHQMDLSRPAAVVSR